LVRLSWSFPVILSGFNEVVVVQFVNQFGEACMGFIKFVGGESGD